MRVGVWAAVALCAAAAAAPARAQSPATLLGGPPPSAITFQPIDMTNVVVAPSLLPKTSRFSFANIFRRITSVGSTTPGVSALPDPSTFPTYPSGQMVGTPPYKLGDPKAAKHPFQPVLPVLNSTGQ